MLGSCCFYVSRNSFSIRWIVFFRVRDDGQLSGQYEGSFRLLGGDWKFSNYGVRFRTDVVRGLVNVRKHTNHSGNALILQTNSLLLPCLSKPFEKRLSTFYLIGNMGIRKYPQGAFCWRSFWSLNRLLVVILVVLVKLYLLHMIYRKVSPESGTRLCYPNCPITVSIHRFASLSPVSFPVFLSPVL